MTFWPRRTINFGDSGGGVEAGPPGVSGLESEAGRAWPPGRGLNSKSRRDGSGLYSGGVVFGVRIGSIGGVTIGWERIAAEGKALPTRAAASSAFTVASTVAAPAGAASALKRCCPHHTQVSAWSGLGS